MTSSLLHRCALLKSCCWSQSLICLHINFDVRIKLGDFCRTSQMWRHYLCSPSSCVNMSASTELISMESKEIQLYHYLCLLTLDLKPNRDIGKCLDHSQAISTWLGNEVVVDLQTIERPGGRPGWGWDKRNSQDCDFWSDFSFPFLNVGGGVVPSWASRGGATSGCGLQVYCAPPHCKCCAPPYCKHRGTL